jgi:hypothetical protein
MHAGGDEPRSSWLRPARIVVAVVAIAGGGSTGALLLSTGSSDQPPGKTLTSTSTAPPPPPIVGVHPFDNRAQERFAGDADRRCRRAVRAARLAANPKLTRTIPATTASDVARHSEHLRELMLLAARLPANAPRRSGAGYREHYRSYRRTLRNETEIERRLVRAIEDGDELAKRIGRSQNAINGPRRTRLARELGFGSCLHGVSS